MRILLDECVDRRLARAFGTLSVRTAVEMGWGGVTNGELLRRAATQFDVLITVDRNLPFQQHLPKYTIAVVLVEAASNRLADLLKLVPEVVETLPTAPRGTVPRVGF